jgi:hypothetical protein
MTAPIATAKMTPAADTRGVRVDADVLYLDDIPKAMDKMGWKTSAALMRYWFSIKPAWAMRPEQRGDQAPDPATLLPSQINDRIVKMEWLLGFERITDIFEDFCQNWNNPAGIQLLIKDRLRKLNWTEGKTAKLGYGLKHAKDLDRICHVNSRIFGGYGDTLDDLFGALFKATLKLAVVGKTSRSLFSKKDIFEVERIGVYVRDTYDFNEDWFNDSAYGLGIWGRDRCLTKVEMAAYKVSPASLNAINFPGFVPVRNTDFRRWQSARNEGGDFYVFSDVMWIPPNVEYITLS